MKIPLFKFIVRSLALCLSLNLTLPAFALRQQQKETEQQVSDLETSLKHKNLNVTGLEELFEALAKEEPFEVILSDLDETAAPSRKADVPDETKGLIRRYLELGGEFGILSTRDEETIRSWVRIEGVKFYGRSGANDPSVRPFIKRRTGRRKVLSERNVIAALREAVEINANWPGASEIIQRKRIRWVDPDNPDMKVFQYGDLSVYVPPEWPANMAILSYRKARDDDLLTDEEVKTGRIALISALEPIQANFFLGAKIHFAGGTSINIEVVNKSDLLLEKFLKPGGGYEGKRILFVDDEGKPGSHVIRAPANQQGVAALNRILEMEIAKREIRAGLEESIAPTKGSSEWILGQLYEDLLAGRRSSLTGAQVEQLIQTLPAWESQVIILWARQSKNQVLLEAIQKKVAEKKPVLSKPALEVYERITHPDLRWDPKTLFDLGIPSEQIVPDPKGINLHQLLDDMVQEFRTSVHSASGIRQIYDPKGKLWGRETKITLASKQWIMNIATAFLALVRERSGKKQPRMVVATDTRHTSPAIAEIAIRTLIANGIPPENILYTGVSTVMEAVVYARQRADAFIYVSASHNPYGQNGVKLGFSNGSLLGPDEAKRFIAQYQQPFRLVTQLAKDGEISTGEFAIFGRVVQDLMNEIRQVSAEAVAQVFDKVSERKEQSRQDYDYFSDQVMTSIYAKSKSTGAELLLHQRKEQIRAVVERQNIWIVHDSTGGASDETTFLESYGFHVVAINTIPRIGMRHHPTPVGDAMEQAKENAIRIWQEGRTQGDNRQVIFIVRDIDGDRKNVGVIQRNGIPLIPGVQKTAALDSAIVLMSLEKQGQLNMNPSGEPNGTLVVNDFSSALTEQLEYLGIPFRLVRTETGEPVLNSRAEELRAQGKNVVALSEWSNGGFWNMELLVREPRHTFRTIINALSDVELFRRLLEHVEGRLISREEFTRRYPQGYMLADLFLALPYENSTSMFETVGERRSLLSNPPSPKDLKVIFQSLFSSYWDSHRSELAQGFEIYWQALRDQAVKNGNTHLTEVLNEALETGFDPMKDFDYQVARSDGGTITISSRVPQFPVTEEDTGGFKIEYLMRVPVEHEGEILWSWRLVGWQMFRASGTESGVIRNGASVSLAIPRAPNIVEFVDQKQQIFDKVLKELLDQAETDLVKSETASAKSGLEERKQAVQNLAVHALEGLLAPPVLVESQVLIFTDPKTFDLVPLAIKWGRTVAVNDNGPEADAIESLLSKLTAPKGTYAIGKEATKLLLKEYQNPVWIAHREDALYRLGLNPNDLPPAIREVIKMTKDCLSLFA